MTVNLDRMLDGYVECADWADCGPDHETHEKEWSPGLVDKMRADCAAFIAACGEPLLDALAEGAPDYSDARFGHDFWLTRNGHGAGYWDRKELEPAAFPEAVIVMSLGNLLTAQAKRFGESNLYLGDDGLVYGYP